MFLELHALALETEADSFEILDFLGQTLRFVFRSFDSRDLLARLVEHAEVIHGMAFESLDLGFQITDSGVLGPHSLLPSPPGLLELGDECEVLVPQLR